MNTIVSSVGILKERSGHLTDEIRYRTSCKNPQLHPENTGWIYDDNCCLFIKGDGGSEDPKISRVAPLSLNHHSFSNAEPIYTK